MPLDTQGNFILNRAYGSNDVRGIIGDELQEIDALRLGRAFGRYHEYRQFEKKVAVGGDVRLSTPMLKSALIQGLGDSGCHVLDLGTIPTPALYFAKEELQTPGAIMVTASHDPANHNGFKPEVGDLPIVGDELADLWHLVLTDACGEGSGSFTQMDILPAYREQLKALIPSKNHLRLVLDPGNGSLSLLAPTLFQELGFDVRSINAKPDGNFPNRPPDSAKAENLVKLGQAVLEQHADLGIAFDGDGDRMGFVDETGRAIDPDRAFLVFIHDVLQRKSGAVVYDLKCSDTIPQAITALGGIPLMEKTGHGFIKYSFLQHHAVLAGELTGHFSFDEIRRDDGLYAALRLTQVVQKLGQPLSVYIDSFPQFNNTPDIRLKASPAEIVATLQAIKNCFSGVEKITELDGVRVDFANGWGLVRGSINSPEITLRFEGRTKANLLDIIAQFIPVHPLIGAALQKIFDQYTIQQ